MTGIITATPQGISPVKSYHHLSQAAGFIFVAGQVARNEDGDWVGLGDIDAQAAQVWRNIDRVLAHAGAGPEHIVKVMTFLTDRAHGPAVSQARMTYLGDHRPPHSGIVVAGMGSPEVMVEVEVIAYLAPR